MDTATCPFCGREVPVVTVDGVGRLTIHRVMAGDLIWDCPDSWAVAPQ